LAHKSGVRPSLWRKKG